VDGGLSRRTKEQTEEADRRSQASHGERSRRTLECEHREILNRRIERISTGVSVSSEVPRVLAEGLFEPTRLPESGSWEKGLTSSEASDEKKLLRGGK